MSRPGARNGRGRGKGGHRGRGLARRLAVQAIYQWQMTGETLAVIERQFVQERGLGKADAEYFHDLLHGVPAHLDALDASFADFLDRPLDELDPVEKAILRLGAYEFSHHPEVPYRVVINEWVEQARTFGAEEGHKYVNGVLDRLARSLRAVEVGAGR